MATSTSKATKRNPLLSLSFRPLHPSSNNILLYTPSSPNTTAPSPKLIIIATWLGGSTPSRIAVYCRGYQALYPSTPVLLIQTVMSDIIKPFLLVQKQLEPARDYILSVFSPTSPHAGRADPADGVLFHIFSHGGCSNMLLLSRLLRSSDIYSSTANDFPIPVVGVILDSCPGTSTVQKDHEAGTYSLPQSQPAHLIGWVLLYPLGYTMYTLQALGVVYSVANMRRELNELNTFGRAPRLYLHSRGDKIVAAKDVQSHAEELSRKDVSVRREVWDRAGHCALPVEDAHRYWSVIQEFVADCRRPKEARLAKL